MEIATMTEECPPTCCCCKQTFDGGETLWDTDGREWCLDCYFEAECNGELNDDEEFL